jgi:hypothetical protein
MKPAEESRNTQELEIRVNNTSEYKSCLTENTVILHYKDQPLNAA